VIWSLLSILGEGVGGEEKGSPGERLRLFRIPALTEILFSTDELRTSVAPGRHSRVRGNDCLVGQASCLSFLDSRVRGIPPFRKGGQGGIFL